MNEISSIAKTKRIHPKSDEISIHDTINYSNLIFHLNFISETKEDSFLINILHLASENSTNKSDFTMFVQHIIIYLSDKEHDVSIKNLSRYFKRNGINSDSAHILKKSLASIAQRCGLITKNTGGIQNIILDNLFKELRITEGIKNKTIGTKHTR